MFGHVWPFPQVAESSVLFVDPSSSTQRSCALSTRSRPIPGLFLVHHLTTLAFSYSNSPLQMASDQTEKS